ncbi:MAG: PepSY domain-containing protein [Pyrinomonadaceae bacterium]|nr:PepSY domain-containing protein [Pyrinomonadaceae bacterium]
MKLFRSVIFWCHLLVGATAGLIIFIMSVTGVLLTYERQIIAWADTRGYHVARPSPAATRLSVETLLVKVREKRPALPSTITLRADPATPAAFGFTGGRTIFVNPYTGEVLGENARRIRPLFRKITDLHRSLGAQGERRDIARAITGACNLGFLFLVTSGFYLWWPRKWTWKLIRNVTWFRRGLSGRARDFNWHNVIGFWLVAPLFIVVLSATVISYPWATNLVYRLVGETPPTPRTAPAQTPVNVAPQPGAMENRDAQEAPPDGLDRLWVRAEQQVLGWQSITLQMPTSLDAPVTFTIDQGSGGQPHKRAQLMLDRTNGEIVRWEPFSSYTRGRQIRSFLRFAHTGEVGGIVGQTIAGLASLGGAMLVWTGLALAWRRSRAWTARRSGAGRIRADSRLAEDATDPS